MAQLTNTVVNGQLAVNGTLLVNSKRVKLDVIPTTTKLVRAMPLTSTSYSEPWSIRVNVGPDAAVSNITILLQAYVANYSNTSVYTGLGVAFFMLTVEDFNVKACLSQETTCSASGTTAGIDAGVILSCQGMTADANGNWIATINITGRNINSTVRMVKYLRL